MKMNWFEGYVGEDEYASGYYENISPHYLSFASFCQGFAAPSVEKPFTFIDIASGQGISTILHAVLFPHGKFYGIDLSPAHIAKSRELAGRVGADNITFIEASMRDLPQLDLPEMDFAVAQGVYSWLSKENQNHIITFLKNKLKAGGIFSIHYMAYPGALIGEVIPKILTTLSQNQTIEHDQRLAKALTEMEKFLEADTGFFGDGEIIKKQIHRYKGQNLKHLAHDLLSIDRRGHFFSEMTKDLAHAKLSYVGSAQLHRMFSLTAIFPQTKTLMSGFHDPIMEHTLYDYASGDATRRDIFQRGPKTLSASLMKEKFRNMHFCRICDITHMQQSVKLSNVSFNIHENSFKLLTSVMKDRFFSGEDVLKAYEKRKMPNPIRDIIANIALFIAAEYVKSVPAVPDKKVLQARSQKYNQEIVHQHLTDSSVLAISVPRTCTGLNINNVERMILSVLVDDPKADIQTIKTRMAAEMKTAGLSLSMHTPDPEDSDKVISSPLEKEKLDSLIETFIQKRKPFLQDAGVF